MSIEDDRRDTEIVSAWFDDGDVPSADQLARRATLMTAARAFASAVVTNAPGSTERSTALRCIRQALSAADAAIVSEPSR